MKDRGGKLGVRGEGGKVEGLIGEIDEWMRREAVHFFTFSHLPISSHCLIPSIHFCITYLSCRSFSSSPPVASSLPSQSLHLTLAIPVHRHRDFIIELQVLRTTILRSFNIPCKSSFKARLSCDAFCERISASCSR